MSSDHQLPPRVAYVTTEKYYHAATVPTGAIFTCRRILPLRSQDLATQKLAIQFSFKAVYHPEDHHGCGE